MLIVKATILSFRGFKVPAENSHSTYAQTGLEVVLVPLSNKALFVKV